MQPAQDPYGFIMNPDSGKKKKGPALNLNLSKKQMIILGVSGFLILAILVTIIFSFINSGPTNKDHLIAVAQKQNELIRVSDIAIKEARGTQALNLAMTTKLSIRSDQATLLATLKANKVKVGTKTLKAAENAETTQKMTEAIQNNRIDSVYMEYIQNALVDYQRSTVTAYQTTELPRLKETMKYQLQNASTIIGVDPEI